MDKEPEASKKRAPEPFPVDPEECLDWDFVIKEPPPKRSGTIHVRLVHKKAEPLPFPDPDEDEPI